MTTVTQSVKPRATPFRPSEPIDPVFRQMRDIVYKVSGIFSPEEKLYLLVDGSAKRIRELKLRGPREYLNHLISHPSRDVELRHLLNELTVGETSLFRSQKQIDALRKVVLPEFAKEKMKQPVKRLRVWSAGCSTGEEAYTLAMSMLEESESLLKGWQIEILATDLNDRSLETANVGIYGDYGLRNTTDYYKRKYFIPVEGTKLQVKPEVKKLISFNRLNLSDDSRMLFMKGMDIIFCCNVLIYFDSASKTKVVDHFFGNLNFGGYFFLGASESLLKLNDSFHLVHFPGTIAYWKPSLKSGLL